MIQRWNSHLERLGTGDESAKGWSADSDSSLRINVILLPGHTSAPWPEGTKMCTGNSPAATAIS